MLLRTLASVMMLALLITGCSPGTEPSPEGGPAVGVAFGNLAPDFQLQGLGGQTFSLSSAKGTPVLLNFWATWCGPCRMVAPVVEELAEEYEGRINFAKVDVDQNPKIASQYGIMSIPTLILFKDGKPLSNIVGFRPKAELKQSLDASLSP